MSDVVIQSTLIPLTVRANVAIRAATMADLPFIDSLQKTHAHQVGWMPTKQLEGKIAAGQVMVAEEAGSMQRAAGSEETDAHLLPAACCRPPAFLGYCIGHDQYFKRDDVGIIYQMNVVPGKQRGLIGATLVKAMFERAAYGCRLFCCWCAQDIEANKFWEAMGFVPLAFRAGSEKKSRVHIFWQRRIRSGDTTTPYWFPAQTTGGSIREDRLVLPIPPGRHWSEVKPMVWPKEEQVDAGATGRGTPRPVLSGAGEKHRSRSTATCGTPVTPPPWTGLGKLWFAPKVEEPVEKPKEPRKKRKNDPKLLAAARELRDRWLERVNADPSVLLAKGKYDASRALPSPAPRELLQLPCPIAA